MISTHVDTSAFPPRALLSDGKVGATLVDDRDDEATSVNKKKGRRFFYFPRGVTMAPLAIFVAFHQNLFGVGGNV